MVHFSDSGAILAMIASEIRTTATVVAFCNTDIFVAGPSYTDAGLANSEAPTWKAL